MANQGKLWFDETVFLDHKSGSQANEWVLSPEKYLNLGDAIMAKFAFDYWAVGPAAGVASQLQIDIERTAGITDVTTAFESFGSSTAMTRTYGTISMSFGLDGGETQGYPKGVARIKLINNDTTADYWGSVRIRAFANLSDG